MKDGSLLFALIAAGIAITLLLYFIVSRLSPFKKIGSPPSVMQRLLFTFVMLYVPVQLLVLLNAGHLMPIGDIHELSFESLNFAILHGILAVMGMVVSHYYSKRDKLYYIIMFFNFGAAVFYFMGSMILMFFVS